MAKVESLQGAEPAEIFESGLDNVDRIAGVALAVAWKDGRVTSGWSNMDPGTLARLVLVLDEAQRGRTIPGDED